MLQKWRILPGLPGEGEIIQFARKGQRTYSEGLVVYAEYSDGNSWVGNFQPYSNQGAFFSGIYKFIDEEYLWVISSGQVFYVPDNSPGDFSVLNINRIIYVHEIVEKKVIIFLGERDMYAFNGLNNIWSAKDISLDDLEFVSANEEYIEVKTWIPWKPKNYTHPILKIDIRTGEPY